MPSSLPRLLPLVLLLGACTEYGYTSQTHKDVFQQNRRNTVDVLLVVDNSGSMIEEQEKLASNFEAFISHFAAVDVDFRIGVVTTDTVQAAHQGRLQGGDDEIVLLNPTGAVVDRVAWDRSWGLQPGVAWQLDPSVTSASGNDAASAWCAATRTYGGADLGTPGEANDACASGPPPVDTGDTAGDTGCDTGDTGDPGDDTGAPGVAGPGAGDILVTEFLADPQDVADADGEWIELTSVAAEDLSLDGCTLVDDGRNAFAFPAGTVLPAGGRLVLARSSGGGVEAAVILGEAVTLNNNVLWITPETDGAAEVFAEMVAVGITGSGMEMGLEAARLALSEPLLSTENEGFLREEASLSVIVVSDEQDSSPDEVDAYVTFLVGLKGELAFRDHHLANVSAVIGKDPPEFEGDPSCSSSHGEAVYGSRYIKAVEYTEGLLESICADDFSPIAERLGLTASGLELEFELSQACDENSLVVSLYAANDDESLVGVLQKDVDYTYVVERNAIRFVEEQVPPSQYYIVAEYRVLAVGADQGGVE